MIRTKIIIELIILVLLIGGKDCITPKRRQGLYLVVLSGIYCQLGDILYATDPTFYKNLKNQLIQGTNMVTCG